MLVLEEVEVEVGEAGSRPERSERVEPEIEISGSAFDGPGARWLFVKRAAWSRASCTTKVGFASCVAVAR